MKRFTALLLTLTLVLAMAACDSSGSTPSEAVPESTPAEGGGSSEAPSGAQPTGDGAELTLWLGSWWEEKAGPIKAAFEADYPQYTLKVDCLPINGYFDNAATAILSGSPPDILDIDVTQISSFAARNLLVDVTGSVGSQLNESDFINSCWSSSHYEGNLYGMPSRGSGTVYFYNMDMFDDAGIDYPTEDWTYEDLLEMAQAITVPGEKYGVGIAADASDPSNVFSSFAPVLWAFGGDFLSADNSECIMNSAESVAAIKFWTELYTVYKVVPEGSLNYTISRDVVPLLDQGQCAMLPFGDSGIEIFGANPDLRWGIVQGPSGQNRAGGWTLTIPVSAAHGEEAVDYLLWFSQPEIQAGLCATGPSNKKAWDLAEPWSSDDYKQIMIAADNGSTLPSVGAWSEAANIVIVELQKVLQGELTPEEGGQSMADQINAIL